MTAADTTGDALQLGQALIEAFNDADWSRYRELVASNVVYEEAGTGRRLEGTDAYLAALEAWKRAIPDAHGAIRASVSSGDTAMFEVVWGGTHTGPLDSPAGAIPATGKQIRVVAAVATTIQGGKVTSIRHYLDVLSLLQQIGAIPTPR